MVHRIESLEYDKIRLDQVVMDINELITKFITTTSDNKLMQSGRNYSNAALEISHYDPNRVCVTKTDFQANTLVANDLIEIEMGGSPAEQLRKGNIDLDFYVHQKGQLCGQGDCYEPSNAARRCPSRVCHELAAYAFNN